MSKPKKSEVIEALDSLLCWATGTSKHDNPYTYPAVKNGLAILARQYGEGVDWLSVKLKGREE